MPQFKTDVVPLGQSLCDSGGETLEITVLDNAAERDRYVKDRADGLCRLATRQAEKLNRPNAFPGTRWVVGKGNIVV